MEQTTLHPYLFFNGNCMEAMSFYKTVLKGELEAMTFAGSEMESQVPTDYKDKIMHASLKFGNALLMASDGMPDQPIKNGDNISLSVSITDQAEAEEIFNALAEGGKVTMPYQKTFWSSYFGQCFDQFGIQWMVSCEA